MEKLIKREAKVHLITEEDPVCGAKEAANGSVVMSTSVSFIIPSCTETGIRGVLGWVRGDNLKIWNWFSDQVGYGDEEGGKGKKSLEFPHDEDSMTRVRVRVGNFFSRQRKENKR